jgi:copper homeostasis protein
MKKRALLEMSVETLDAAVAALRGGADRVELCADLSVGGLTPSAELMRQAREHIAVPIFAMIRPRGGDFNYSATEFHQMKLDIGLAKNVGMDGVVFGILTSQRGVDVERNAELVGAAKPLPTTFHRAFDELADLPAGLENVIATGATRVLTSGGAACAEEGAAMIAKLLRQASNRIMILPGGGIRPGNLRKVARAARASEYHSGLSNLVRGPGGTCERFEEGVRALVKVLEEETRLLEPATTID